MEALTDAALRGTDPDEVVVAVMASSINYNTVWSAMFEPVSTFSALERFVAGADSRPVTTCLIRSSDPMPPVSSSGGARVCG